MFDVKKFIWKHIFFSFIVNFCSFLVDTSLLTNLRSMWDRWFWDASTSNLDKLALCGICKVHKANNLFLIMFHILGSYFTNLQIMLACFDHLITWHTNCLCKWYTYLLFHVILHNSHRSKYVLRVYMNIYRFYY